MNRNATMIICTAIILVAIIAVYWKLKEQLNDLQLRADRAVMTPVRDDRDRFCSKHPTGFRPSHVGSPVKKES